MLTDAIDEPDFAKALVALFNDGDPAHSESLVSAIDELPGIDQLRFKPQVGSMSVGKEFEDMFRKMNLVPTFFFVDPWGYKGLSLGLIQSVLKDFGCDCVFFFNYNRINMGLPNDRVEEHMNALFGEARADDLRARIKGLNPQDRELAIVEELSNALRDLGGRFVLPFRFVDDRRNRTSHHLIFVTKHFKGYEIMKGIMTTESSRIIDGVGSFSFNPADHRFPMLFNFDRPLEGLGDSVLERFAGQTRGIREVYEAHSVGTAFLEKHYREVLLKLEEEGKVHCNPAIGQGTPKRRRNTLAPRVQIVFPAKAVPAAPANPAAIPST